MRYLCLVYADESLAETLERGEVDTMDEECEMFSQELMASGRYVVSGALQPEANAATVRAAAGGIALTGGPVAEAKKRLDGFYLIEARDLNEAIQVVSRIPAGRLGPVEVRPLIDR